MSGSSVAPKRRAAQPAIAARSSGSPTALGYGASGVIASASTSRMNAGVSSRGSPIPKSMISTPAARSRARACSSRTNGYVPSPASTGERRTRHVPKASSTWKERSSAAISTDSSRWWACEVAPGPKLTAG